MANEKFDVAVVGSCFVDLLFYVADVPKPGETVKGTTFQKDFGGKAANQCVMAAKLGARTAIVAKLGDDAFGRDTVDNFKGYGVNTKYVKFTDEASTGVTNIFVNNEGQPAFVSLAGANKLLTVADVKSALGVIAASSILICDKGIPLNIGAAALELGKELGCVTMFNPSPKVKSIPVSMYHMIDVMVINADEGCFMTGMSVNCERDAEAVIAEFHRRGSLKVVLTLGKDGAVCSEKSSDNIDDTIISHIPAPTVEVVDTTGAGDALMGSLAYFMACQPGLPFADMVGISIYIASQTVTKHGVQASYPAREQLPQHLFQVLSANAPPWPSDCDAITC